MLVPQARDQLLLLEQVAKAGVRAQAVDMAKPVGIQRAEVTRVETHGRDARPGQRVVEAALALLLVLHRRRVLNVGHDPLELGAAAVDPEELGHGQPQPAEVVVPPGHEAAQVDQGLDGPLAEGGLADDDAAPVVLDGAGEDLRGRGAVPVDQHREGPLVDHLGIRVLLHLQVAVRTADLDHRAGSNEEAGQFGRLHQGAAAVAAQVDDDPVDPFGLELLEQPADVARRAAKVLVAAGRPLEVAVEGGQFDHPDAQGTHAVQALDDPLLGRLVLQLDLVALEHDQGRRLVRPRLLRQDLQPDRGALGPSNPVDHVLQAPADHVLDLALLTLADTDDPVPRVDLAAGVRRAAGDHALDPGVLVVGPQHRPYALEGEAHADVEVLGRARRHVGGVGLQADRVAVDEGLEDVVRAELVNPAPQGLVTGAQGPGDLLRRLAREAQGEHVVFHPLAPELVQRRAVGGPVRLAPVEAVLLVDGEVELVLEQREAVGHPLVDALPVDLEYVEGGVEVGEPQGVVQPLAVGVEPRHVPGAEETLVAVQGLQVLVQYPGGHRVVQGLLPVVVLVDHLEDDQRRLAVLARRLELLDRDAGHLGERGDGAEQQQERQ